MFTKRQGRFEIGQGLLDFEERPKRPMDLRTSKNVDCPKKHDDTE